jgi:hypothetical protein
MGIHVTRSNRGTAAVRYVRRPGETARPATHRPGPAAAGASKGGVKTGGSSGTRGDFGADFE